MRGRLCCPFLESIILAQVAGVLLLRAAFAAWLAVGSVTTAFAATDRQTRIVELPASRSLSIEITIGSIRIEGSDRTNAEIVIDRDLPNAAASNRLPVVIDESPER